MIADYPPLSTMDILSRLMRCCRWAVEFRPGKRKPSHTCAPTKPETGGLLVYCIAGLLNGCKTVSARVVVQLDSSLGPKDRHLVARPLERGSWATKAMSAAGAEEEQRECRPFGPQEILAFLFHALTDVATNCRSFGPKAYSRPKLNQRLA
jgi:hypothetical protein